jgi:hypothetical protein
MSVRMGASRILMAQRPGSVFLVALAAGAAAFHTHLLVLAEPGELWFAKIKRDLIARGILTRSVTWLIN